MSVAPCSSCGTVNSPGLVYCANCGALLTATTDNRQDQSVHSAAFVASRRALLDSSGRTLERHSFFPWMFGVIRYLFAVAVGTTVVLIMMDPEGVPSLPAYASVITARGGVTGSSATDIDRLFNTHGVLVQMTQDMINASLMNAGRDSVSASETVAGAAGWGRRRALLLQNKVIYFQDYGIAGHWIRFSETFQLVGNPGAWSLAPESGTVGMLSLGGFLLVPLTHCIGSSTEFISERLKSLSEATSIRIHPGRMDFSLP